MCRRCRGLYCLIHNEGSDQQTVSAALCPRGGLLTARMEDVACADQVCLSFFLFFPPAASVTVRLHPPSQPKTRGRLLTLVFCFGRVRWPRRPAARALLSCVTFSCLLLIGHKPARNLDLHMSGETPQLGPGSSKTRLAERAKPVAIFMRRSPKRREKKQR